MMLDEIEKKRIWVRLIDGEGKPKCMTLNTQHQTPCSASEAWSHNQSMSDAYPGPRVRAN